MSDHNYCIVDKTTKKREMLNILSETVERKTKLDSYTVTTMNKSEWKEFHLELNSEIEKLKSIHITHRDFTVLINEDNIKSHIRATKLIPNFANIKESVQEQWFGTTSEEKCSSFIFF